MNTLLVNEQLIAALDVLRLNLTHYYLLLLAHTGKYKPISIPCDQTLSRKGYIVDGKLTPDGNDLWNGLHKIISEQVENTGEELKTKLKQSKKERNELFEVWWKTYPSTTTYIDETGHEWFGGRVLKVLKPKCQVYFEQCIKEGDNPEDMIKALEYEIEIRKKKTKMTEQNDFNYMKASSSYLNQRVHRDILESIADKPEIPAINSTMQTIKNQARSNNDFL